MQNSIARTASPLFQLVIYFAVFSFCGWVSETLICSFTEKRFVKRGFLTGPFIPVYGFGGLIIVVLLAPLKPHPILLYIAGVVSVTVLEYTTALVMESIFQVKLWDYSEKKCNFQGRVWLVSSLFFGLLGMFGVYVLNPPMVAFIHNLPPRAVNMIGIAFLLYFVLDTVNSTVTLATLRHKLSNLSKQLEEAYRKHKETTATKTTWFQRRMIGAYPHISSKRYHNALKELQEGIKEYRQQKETKQK